jgi:hypothetical protein
MHGSERAPRRFFYCRTPLQALVIQRIQALASGRDTIVYHPTSQSARHAHYAKRLRGERVFFLPFTDPFNSHLVSEVVAFLRIPADIRRARYDEMFISSIGTFAFAVMAGRNKDAALKTFDDGTFNLRRAHFFAWINAREPAYYRALRTTFAAKSNREIIESSKAHYTIFDRSLCVTPAEIVVQLDLFHWLPDGAPRDKRKLLVLLGTPIHLVAPAKADRYLAFVRELRPDLYIPHPAEMTVAPIETPFAADPEIRRNLNERIAEEIVLILVQRGHPLEVHGFSSTALLNIAKLVEVHNHFIGSPEPDLAALFSKFRIPSDMVL